ncbi:MAG: hypothetical protein FJ280_12655 [Planctomycetes bacterium]|nr:hypothetical protein [Planctomycetota bacterium]
MRLSARLVGLLAALAVFTAGTPVLAGPTYGFFNITNNSAGDAAIGEAQFFLEVLPEGDNVRFRFYNIGPEASALTDVYFDDGSLFGIASIINGTGVLFSAPANPPDLPGGNNVVPPFVATVGFSADSDPPVASNGVNPGEELSIVFALQSGKTYADVLDDLGSATLRVGIHVQGFAGGGSESFINIVPAPGAVVLCILGTGLVGRLRRRRWL